VLSAGGKDLAGSGTGAGFAAGAGLGVGTGATTGFCGAGVSHPVSSETTAASAQHTRRGWIRGADWLKCGISSIARSIAPIFAMESLFWFMLEAGVALLILILIVWWTWPRKK
jgi:hypothetical protein